MTHRTRKITLIFLALLIVGAMGLHGCSGCGDKQKEPIDLGVVEKGLYLNDYFGLQMELNPDWSMLDRGQIEALLAQTIDYVDQKGVDTAEEIAILFFGGRQREDGTFQCSLHISAQRIGKDPSLADPRQYLATSLESVQSVCNVVEYSTIEKTSIGGKRFYSRKFTIEEPANLFMQNTIVSVQRDCLFSFVVTYQNQEQLKEIDHMLESVIIGK